MDLLPFVQDYARREDEKAQKRIHDLIIKVYSELNLPLIYEPILPAIERVDFILKNMK